MSSVDASAGKVLRRRGLQQKGELTSLKFVTCRLSSRVFDATVQILGSGAWEVRGARHPLARRLPNSRRERADCLTDDYFDFVISVQ